MLYLCLMQISVPMHIIRDVGETPKIKELQAQPLGTIVNGLFAVLKVCLNIWFYIAY